MVKEKERRLLRKILAPVDGSESSQQAQEVTLRIARQTGAPVTVMHVIPYSLLYAKLKSGYQIRADIRDQIIGGIEEHAQKVIDDAQAFLTKGGVSVETNRRDYSDIAYSILRVSNRDYDLIVMGSRGENEKDPYGVGSVARKVVRHSSIPALLVKKTSSLSTMLVCIDGSKHAVDALTFAVKLGEKMDSKITLVNVQERHLHELSPGTAEELGQHILSDALDSITRKELHIEKRVAFGVPAEGIVELADREKQDLIVMSSLGLGAVARFLLGSVSEDVINKCKCSILIVPPRR